MRNKPDDLSNQIIGKIKKWLKEEIKYNKPILEDEDMMMLSDSEIHEGRNEVAQGLLKLIKKWEKEYHGIL